MKLMVFNVQIEVTTVHAKMVGTKSKTAGTNFARDSVKSITDITIREEGTKTEADVSSVKANTRNAGMAGAARFLSLLSARKD
jgi:hypothetical protein